MSKKRHTPEQIIRILREADSGLKVVEICQKHNISEQTFYRWRSKYGEMTVEESKRLKAFEEENSRLKKLAAELMLQNEMLRELNEKKW